MRVRRDYTNGIRARNNFEDTMQRICGHALSKSKATIKVFQKVRPQTLDNGFTWNT